MRYWLFLLYLPALLYGEISQQAEVQEPPLAPLVPLEPQFPLGLTEVNRQFLMESPTRLAEETQRNQRLLAEHTFPWLMLTILLGLGGVGWMGWAAYLMRERWLTKPREHKVKPSPELQVKQAFAELRNRHLLEQRKFKPYYAELTAILLAVLQERTGLPATRLTTFELNQMLASQSTISQNQQSEILSFLAKADQIKFAGKEPSLEEGRNDDQYIQNLIEKLHLVGVMNSSIKYRQI